MKLFIDNSDNKIIRIYGEKKENDRLPEGYKAEYHPETPASVGSGASGWGEESPARDCKLEDPKGRKPWDKAPDFGDLSISIQPGDERIGELYFNVQYEGPNHQPDRCVDGLNLALPDVRKWIEEILTATTDASKSGEPVLEIQLDSRPCPKGPHRIKIEALAMQDQTQDQRQEVGPKQALNQRRNQQMENRP